MPVGALERWGRMGFKLAGPAVLGLSAGVRSGYKKTTSTWRERTSHSICSARPVPVPAFQHQPNGRRTDALEASGVGSKERFVEEQRTDLSSHSAASSAPLLSEAISPSDIPISIRPVVACNCLRGGALGRRIRHCPTCGAGPWWCFGRVSRGLPVESAAARGSLPAAPMARAIKGISCAWARGAGRVEWRGRV